MSGKGTVRGTFMGSFVCCCCCGCGGVGRFRDSLLQQQNRQVPYLQTEMVGFPGIDCVCVCVHCGKLLSGRDRVWFVVTGSFIR